MSLLSYMPACPSIVERVGGRWMLHVRLSTRWFLQEFEAKEIQVKGNFRSFPLLFVDSATLDQFLADTDPRLAKYRDYTQMVREFRHQGLALTMDELLAMARGFFPELKPESGSDVRWVQLELDRDSGPVNRSAYMPTFFSFYSTATWPFGIAMGADNLKFSFVSALAAEELVADVYTGVTSGGTPVRLRNFASCSVDVEGQGLDGFEIEVALLFRAEGRHHRLPCYLEEGRLAFLDDEDYSIAKYHAGAAMFLDDTQDAEAPASDDRPDWTLANRVMPFDVVSAHFMH